MANIVQLLFIARESKFVVSALKNSKFGSFKKFCSSPYGLFAPLRVLFLCLLIERRYESNGQRKTERDTD